MRKLNWLLGAAFMAASAYGADPGKFNCKVGHVEPEFANFFGIGTRGPEVGETIEIDLDQKEIAALTFSGGGVVPIEQVKAKLVKQVLPNGQEDYQVLFKGTHKSRTSDYTGVLHGYFDTQTAGLNIEVLRQEFSGPMNLHKLSMECTHVP
jgi:hypothetical protein